MAKLVVEYRDAAVIGPDDVRREGLELRCTHCGAVVRVVGGGRKSLFRGLYLMRARCASGSKSFTFRRAG